jgi:hypothetical protein
MIITFAERLFFNKNFARLTFFLLFLFSIPTVLKAQEFGGNPPSIKWQQINTPAAKVIFPTGLDSSGLWVANIVQQMNKSILQTIGTKQKQVSILLQNQTTIANGYVGLAPFRSEFYLTPDQNSFELGSLPWPEQLAIHEFRHVQQYNNFNVGLSKVLHILFGEGGQALANDLAVPNWFFEGDAVFNETHVSDQGRGRLPYFLNGYRALWADGRDYSYMKLRNGSYRDYTPDWYPLGYMLVSYGREKYGDYFWKKVTHDAASYKGGFYPFERAIKKYSGVSFKQFRNAGLDYFKEQFLRIDSSEYPPNYWKQNDGYLYRIPVNYIHRHFIADQEYPAYVNDSTLIYMKSTYDHNPVFVIKTGNKERKISVRSVSLDSYFAYHNGKIVYTTYRPDLRWNYRDYSELVLLDVKTGKEHRLTSKAKYFSPDFSADGKTIVAVKVGPSGKSDLHLLDAANGKLLTVVPNKAGLFFTYPKFYDDSHLLSAVRNNKGKMSLALINITTGNVKYLLPFSYQPIVFPSVHHDTVYFTATSGINDRLFALMVDEHKLYELKGDSLHSFIGNYEPVVFNNKLAWVSFSAFGYKIHQIDKNAVQWAALDDNKIPGGLPNFNISALKRDSSTDLLASVLDTSLTITKYLKSHHLFNFHSLIPNIDDPNYTLSIAGENVLNTFQSDLSFNYNRDEGYKEFEFDAIYGALFPYISGGADYILDRRNYYNGSNVYWNETDLHGGLELPLNFSSGKSYTSLSFGTDLYYSSSNFQAAYRDLFANQSYAYLNNYLNFSYSIQQAKQNIYPRFGQNISLEYKSAIAGLSATQFLATGNFYFPGILVNHNFVINLAHQEKGDNSNVIDYSNDFPFSRGYTAENLHDMNKIGANYTFPIAYPDAGVANTVYLLRLRGNLFYDYTHTTDFYADGSPFKADFRSTGMELFFDTQWFNQEAISFGIRYSRLLDPDIFGGTGRNRIEIVLPVSFF